MITPRTEYRLYEMLLGVLVWSTLLFAVVLSFVKPLWAVICIIIFDVYWLLRIVYFTLNLLVAWRQLKKVSKQSWFAKLQMIPDWNNKVNFFVFPTYKEDANVIVSTLRSLAMSSYPPRQVVVIVAGEENDQEHFEDVKKKILEIYQNVFADIVFTLHPSRVEGELPGKGSNLHSVGPILKTYADTHGFAYRDVIVSAFDVDTIVHSEYIAYLTYVFCTHSNPTRSSYQPIPLYTNNFWEVPSLARIMAFGTTFWMLSEVTRPQRLWTFSSHSMSLSALIDCGFWQKNVVSEDSRIFLQMFLRYEGNYEVTPLYLTVSMDTVIGSTLWKSIKNIYLQQRRWAWGAENLPFMLWHFRRNHRISVRKKMRMIFNYVEGMYSWSLVAILILIMGRLPLYLGSATFLESILFQNTPQVLERLMGLAMIGLIVSAMLSFTLLPTSHVKIRFKTYASFVAHWFLLPITLIGLGSFPALEAQTRMMMGSYLGFNVTLKKRN